MRSLTSEQLYKIMTEIWKNHRFGGLSRSDHPHMKGIKYVEPVFDMRDGSCFVIRFWGYVDKNFDFRDNDQPMFERIMNWLDQ